MTHDITAHHGHPVENIPDGWGHTDPVYAVGASLTETGRFRHECDFDDAWIDVVRTIHADGSVSMYAIASRAEDTGNWFIPWLHENDEETSWRCEEGPDDAYLRLVSISAACGHAWSYGHGETWTPGDEPHGVRTYIVRNDDA